MSTTLTLDRLLTQDEVAEKLQVSKSTLRNWRASKKGPPIVLIGQQIRYRPEDVTAWINAQVEKH